MLSIHSAKASAFTVFSSSFGNFSLCKLGVRANGCSAENFFTSEWKFQFLY